MSRTRGCLFAAVVDAVDAGRIFGGVQQLPFLIEVVVHDLGRLHEVEAFDAGFGVLLYFDGHFFEKDFFLDVVEGNFSRLFIYFDG